MKRFPRYLLVSAIIIVVFCFLDGFNDIGLSVFMGALFGLFSLIPDTKEERAEKKALRERKEKERQAEEEARNAPGCYSKDGVDIMTFSSKNNILTAGNNWLQYKIRNRNSYGVIVTVRYKYSYGWEKSTHSYEVDGNRIRTISASGEAWMKATDITIVQVH